MANTAFRNKLRDEDLASWGAYALEDMGIIEVDRLIGTASALGAAIRAELLNHKGELTHHWSLVAQRLHHVSPGMSNPAAMIAVLCQLACTRLFIEDRLHVRS